MNENRKNSNDRKTGKSSNRRKGSKNQNRRFDRKEDKFDKEACGGKTRASNHPSWYGAESVMMKDAASLPFGSAAGMPLTYTDGVQQVDHAIDQKIVIPGIMTLNVLPLPGRIGDWSDPFNVAIRDKYSFIRHANSGHANYDASDLGMYFLAYDACATFYAYMCRLYGLLRTTSPTNRYMPSDLITALGADYTSLVANMAQFRAYINSFPARLTLRVPSDLTFIERHMWMFSNVFMDAPNTKAQIYALKPAAFWRHTLTFTDQYMELAWHDPHDLTYNDLVNMGEALLNSVLNSEDFNIMSGDIMKAYGDKLYVLNMIPEDFFVAPVFDPEFLLQFHNATILDANPEAWRIVEIRGEEGDQYTGAITDNNTFKLTTTGVGSYANAYGCMRKFLDMPLENPSPKEVAIATRLMSAAKVDLDGDFHLDVYGTEVVTSAHIWTHDFNTGRPSSDKLDYFNNIPIEVFGSHPIMLEFQTDDEGVAGPLTELSFIVGARIVGDLDNVTTVPRDVLYNIHRAAVLAMFGLAK